MIRLIKIFAPCCVILFILIFISSCEESTNSTKDKTTLLKLLPEKIIGYLNPASKEKSDNTIFGIAKIPGGYAWRVWFNSDSSSFIAASLFNYKSDSAANYAFNKTSLEHSLFEIFADGAFFVGENSRKGTPGFNMYVFRKKEFLVFLCSGIRDSSAVPADQQLLKSIAIQSDSLIDKYGSDIQAAAISAVLDNSFINANLKNTKINGRKNALQKIEKRNFELKYNGTTIGNFQLKITLDSMGICDSYCGTNPSIPCEMIQIRCFITGLELYDNADDQDPDNNPFWSDDADIIMGGSVNVVTNCNSLERYLFEFTTAEVCDITAGEKFYEDSVDPDYRISKFLFGDNLLPCNCPLNNINFSFDILVRDNDSGDLSEFVISILKCIWSDDPAKMKILETISGNGNTPRDVIGSDPMNRLRSSDPDGEDVGEARGNFDLEHP